MKLSLSLSPSATVSDLAPLVEAARASGVVVDMTIGAVALDVSRLPPPVERPRAKTIARPAAPSKLARDTAAPWGRKADGTPRRKPGRKVRSVKRGAK